MNSGNDPADRLKPRHGFIADDEGRLIYIPPIGGPRLVPSKEDALRFARDANRCFIVALALWACGAGALVIMEVRPIKQPFEWLVLVFATRIVSAAVLARRWEPAAARTVNFVPLAAAALSRQSRSILLGKLLLYGFIALLCVAGAVALPFAMQSIWITLPPEKQARVIMLFTLSILFAPLFATNAHRVQLALRHRQRSRASVAVHRR